MLIHFIIHESFEAPGAYETWAQEKGYTIAYSRLYLGQSLPDSIDAIDLLVVLGGPQSPSTTTDECPYFDAAAEQKLILACVHCNKAVVGVCLGAQLIGEALDASTEKSPEPEIGCFPIHLTEVGRSDAKFAHFGGELMVGHWHGDMPGLTVDAKVVATSIGCPRQIVEYGDLVYGFQCHMEFTEEVVEALIEASDCELRMLDGRAFVQQPEALRVYEYMQMNDKLFIFLDHLMALYGQSFSRDIEKRKAREG